MPPNELGHLVPRNGSERAHILVICSDDASEYGVKRAHVVVGERELGQAEWSFEVFGVRCAAFGGNWGAGGDGDYVAGSGRETVLALERRRCGHDCFGCCGDRTFFSVRSR